MKTYKVILDEIRTYEIEVDADNLEDAETKANNMVSENEPYETNWKVYSVEEIENVTV
jgi:hypothetical protein